MKKKTKASEPVLVINLAGGCVHDVRSNIPELKHARIIFTGEYDDVSGDDDPAQVEDSNDYIYTTRRGAEELSAEYAADVLRAADKYEEQ